MRKKAKKPTKTPQKSIRKPPKQNSTTPKIICDVCCDKEKNATKISNILQKHFQLYCQDPRLFNIKYLCSYCKKLAYNDRDYFLRALSHSDQLALLKQRRKQKKKIQSPIQKNVANVKKREAERIDLVKNNGVIVDTALTTTLRSLRSHSIIQLSLPLLKSRDLTITPLLLLVHSILKLEKRLLI